MNTKKTPLVATIRRNLIHFIFTSTLIFYAAPSAAVETPKDKCFLLLTAKQQRVVLEHGIRDIQRAWRMKSGILDMSEEAAMLRVVFPLFNRLYLYQTDDKPKYMKVTDAHRFMPVTNKSTQQKYLELAINNGFLTLQPSLQDRRKIFVLPTQKTIDLVENELSLIIDEKRELARELGWVP